MPLTADGRFRLFFALDFGAIGIFFPFIALYLASIGMSGGQIGILLATIPLVRFLVQPLWGVVSDVYHLHRPALTGACFALAAAAIAFPLTRDFWALLALVIVIAIAQAPITPLGTALALEHLDRFNRRARFGSLRLWGSVGFAVAAFLVGAAFVEQAVWLILPIYALIVLAIGLVALTLPDAEVHLEIRWREGLSLLIRERNLLKFLAGALLLGATLGVVNSYLSVYLVDIHGAGWMIGAAPALAAMWEVPLMLATPLFLARWGLRLVLVAGVALLPVRWFLYALIEEPLLVLPTQLIHSVAIMSLFVVGVIYVDQHLAPAWRATAQSLYLAVSHGIGPGIGLLGAGFIYEWSGIRLVWLICTVVASAGVLMIYWAVRPLAVPNDQGIAPADEGLGTKQMLNPPASRSIRTAHAANARFANLGFEATQRGQERAEVPGRRPSDR